MPCFNPRRLLVDYKGEINWKADYRLAFPSDSRINIPCRKCLGCNQATAREWSVRCFHEAQLHTQNWRDEETRVTTKIPNSSVLTLTYNDAHLPKYGALRHDDIQRFLKRLRKNKSVRYFMCGEYGGKTARPHYHLIIYGESFPDRYTEQTRDGQTNQMSHTLDKLWSQPTCPGEPSTNIGRATVDDFTFAGAGYVAGYIAKKSNVYQSGPLVDLVQISTGEVTTVPMAPEYRKMSTAPGIGADWIVKRENLSFVYDADCVRISAFRFNPPRYYDRLLERCRPEVAAAIRLKRKESMHDSAITWDQNRCNSAELSAISDLQLRRDSL